MGRIRIPEEILYREGYIKSFEQINDNAQGTIRITLKYGEKGAKGQFGCDVFWY